MTGIAFFLRCLPKLQQLRFPLAAMAAAEAAMIAWLQWPAAVVTAAMLLLWLLQKLLVWFLRWPMHLLLHGCC